MIMIDWKWNVKNKDVLNKRNVFDFNIVTYHSFGDGFGDGYLIAI